MACDEQLHGLLVRGEVGREAALVADRGRQAPLVQDLLEHVVGLGAPAQRLGERGGADRHDHELLQVDVVVGVRAAVEDVHHRHGQHVGVDAADVAVQRQLELVGRGLGHGQRHAEDGVGAEPGLVVGAVEVDQHPVDVALIEGVEARPGRRRSRRRRGRRRRARPCRRSGRRRRAARPPRTAPVDAPDGTMARPVGAGVEEHLDLDRGVATGVEDLAADDVLDDAHGGGWLLVVGGLV